MGIIILLFCFISIFLSLGISTKISGKKELLIISALSFSAIVVFLTEISSLLHRLNYQFLLAGWSLLTVALIIYLYLNNQKTRDFTTNLWVDIEKKLAYLTKTDKIFLTASGIILLLIFVAALVYPSNNWDSMTYHMARITSWVSHQSLAHYPTDITRQLYQPPFAELVIMNFGILSRSDNFSNTVQFIFLLFTIITIISIVELLGLNRTYKIIAIVLAVTIPEVILQGSSTQNDIVVAFFILTSLLFTIKSIKEPCLKNYVVIGLCTGLGLLTKGTAYIYLPPILLLFGIIVLKQLIKNRNYHYLWYALVAMVITIGLNAGHFSRNYKLTYNILGTDQAESKLYANQKMSPTLLFSSVIKNAGLHTGVMFIKPAATFSDKVIYKLHDAMGIDINYTTVNYRDLKYSAGTLITDENGASNPFHFLLIAAVMFLVVYNFLKGRRDIKVILLFLIILLQGLFFCYYLRWQPWHSRLQIPLFLIAIPIICYCININSGFRKIFYWLSPAILIYALLVIFHSTQRPYSKQMFAKRYAKYFTGNITLCDEYTGITESMQKSGYKNIGLILGIDDWEYPFFTQCFSRQINPVYINVDNFSKAAPSVQVNIDCIVSTTVNKAFIDYKGRRYANKLARNKIVWLYE